MFEFHNSEEDILKNIIFGLSLAISKKEIYNDKLKRAGNVLAAYSISKGEKPAANMIELIQLCYQPIGTWPMFSSNSDYQEEVLLLKNGNLSDFAEELRNKNIILDLMALASQEEYVKVRKFIIENPLLYGEEILEIESNFDNNLYDYINKHYERLPDDCIRDGFAYKCENCGWIIRWDKHNEPYCVREECRDKTNNFRDIVQIDNPEYLYRLKKESINFISIPGQSELKIYNELKNISNVKVELWPHLDRYDLKIVIGNNIWAADVKDWIHPYALGANITDIPGEEWSYGYYIIPDYRADSTYLEIVKNTSNLSQRNVEVISEREFINKIKKESEII
ncbi:MAG: hypothetical protein ACOCV1_05000 [Bacillota bacterium]